ncbi:DUF7854 family protein [Halorussus salinus]|uniref:DUF7854 family protein n=1 Tax=Halorussus salinus TaxID=1364935 RepID=UPI001092850A|nr:hypothetical protein [Halorussus salinus]
MDRISALRNVEEALADFESGEADLRATERRVVNVLRTYATEFEDDQLSVYRASGTDEAEGVVVVAESASRARENVAERVETDESAVEVRELS